LRNVCPEFFILSLNLARPFQDAAIWKARHVAFLHLTPVILVFPVVFPWVPGSVRRIEMLVIAFE
jgi:hypothetical protein